MQAKAGQPPNAGKHGIGKQAFQNVWDSLIIFDFHEETLDKVPFLVVCVAVPRISSIGLGWNTKIRITVSNIFP